MDYELVGFGLVTFVSVSVLVFFMKTVSECFSYRRTQLQHDIVKDYASLALKASKEYRAWTIPENQEKRVHITQDVQKNVNVSQEPQKSEVHIVQETNLLTKALVGTYVVGLGICAGKFFVDAGMRSLNNYFERRYRPDAAQVAQPAAIPVRLNNHNNC